MATAGAGGEFGESETDAADEFGGKRPRRRRRKNNNRDRKRKRRTTTNQHSV